MGNRLVLLTVYYSVMEAKICVSMLQAHGIFAVAPTDVANNAPHMMTAIGGIEVMVVESDYEAAKALLGDVKQAEPAPPRKPFLTTLWDGLRGLVVLVFFGVPPAPVPPKSGETDTRDGRSER